MKNYIEKFRKFCYKYKVFTYAGLLFLTYQNFILREQNQKHSVVIEELKIQVSELRKDNIGFKNNLIIYNRGYESFPLPLWEKLIKNKTSILQYINPSYVNQFGHEFDYDRYKYIGSTDYAIYPKDVADRFYEIDMDVAKTGNIERMKEWVYDRDSIKTMLDVIKWRVIERKDTLVRGMVLRAKKSNIK